MNKIFIFDVDEVLCDVKEATYNALKTEFGIDFHHSLWEQYYIGDYFGITNDMLLKTLVKYNVLENAKLEEGVIELIDYLKYSRIDPMALSARNWRTDGLKLTQLYFEANNVKIDKIKLVGATEPKYMEINKLKGEIIGFIDDNPNHITQAFENCNHINKLFIKDQPWNTQITIESNKIHRVKNLHEVQNELENILVNNNKIKGLKL